MEELTRLIIDGLSGYDRFFTSPLILVMALVYLIAATYTDIKSLKIPNKLNFIFLIPVLVNQVLLPVIVGDWKEGLSNLGGGAIGFMVLLIPAVITGFQMAGDIKFIGVFGMLIGISGIVPFMILAIVINVLTNLAIIKLKKRSMKNIVPFAPFFMAAFITCLLVSQIL